MKLSTAPPNESDESHFDGRCSKPQAVGTVSTPLRGLEQKGTLMQGNSNQPHRIDLRLRGALMHPMRIGILDYLIGDREGIGKEELAAALDLNVPQVEYHLKVLHDADLIADAEDERARGAGERFYVAAVAASR